VRLGLPTVVCLAIGMLCARTVSAQSQAEAVPLSSRSQSEVTLISPMSAQSQAEAESLSPLSARSQSEITLVSPMSAQSQVGAVSLSPLSARSQSELTLISPVSAQWQPEATRVSPLSDHSLRIPALVWAAGVAADQATTYRFSSRYGDLLHERNPLIQGLDPHPVLLVAAGSAIDAATGWAVYHYLGRHPRLARIAFYGAAAYRSYLAVYNVQMMRQAQQLRMTAAALALSSR
jgi:hypothetical protein